MEATTARVPRRGTNDVVGGEGEFVQRTIRQPAEAIADPAPLGLAAFALTTFVLSFFNANLVNPGGEPVVLALALAYGGLAQLLAGMWEFKNNNTFGATAFSSFGAFWISLFVFDQFLAGSVPAAHLGDAVGLYLIGWGIFTTYMLIASLRVSVAVALVFVLLAPTFIVLGIGNSAGNDTIIHIGGWLGIATAIVAWYASFASVTNKTFGRIVLPVKELHG
ncbi:MAG TPA: acetate uptake transporter [Solirubrobacterales bacterium]|nr:acetate uptake transporter [Solirubrobacterales bacterium]